MQIQTYPSEAWSWRLRGDPASLLCKCFEPLRTEAKKNAMMKLFFLIAGIFVGKQLGIHYFGCTSILRIEEHSGRSGHRSHPRHITITIKNLRH